MSVVMCRKTRRQFLVGTGKTLLALPLLPSLLPREAQSATTAIPKRMMVFWFDHANEKEHWPARDIATTAIGTAGAKEVLLRQQFASAKGISSIFNHPMYDTLRSKDLISIVRGMDVQAGSGHGFSPMGGNAGTDAGNLVQSPSNMPTFDSLIEQSQAVYPNASTPNNVMKAMRVSFTGSGAYIQRVGTKHQFLPAYGLDANSYFAAVKYQTIPVFYRDLFSGLTAGTVRVADMTSSLKSNILNRVIASYAEFKTSRKVSAVDKDRMDQHLSFISDVQRAFTGGSALSCGVPTEPGDMKQDPNIFIPAYLKLMVLAFQCGLSKFGAVQWESQDGGGIPNLGLPPGLNLHGAIHGTENDPVAAELKGRVFQAYHQFGLDMMAEHFITPMMAEEGGSGRSYIDNMATLALYQMGMESQYTGSGHTGSDMQQVLFGSMGGKIRSGRYTALPEIDGQRLPYNTYVQTMLELMGVPSTEYSKVSNSGQGFGYYQSPATHPLASRFYTPLTELLT